MSSARQAGRRRSREIDAVPGGGSVDLHLRPRAIEPIAPDAVPVIEAVNISKAFGATTALVDVSLKAYSGRILALLGDNGAGKSTLIKILSGVFPPDRGELRFRGEPVRFANPAGGAAARDRDRVSGSGGMRTVVGDAQRRSRP